MANEMRLVSKTVDIKTDLGAIDNSYALGIVYNDVRRTGGNAFIWKPSGTANNGTTYAGATGIWEMQFDGPINVEWFGAVGDGSANDLKAINDALIAGKGGEVYMPQNSYNISGGSILVPSNTSLIGDGPTLTIIKIKAPETGGNYNTIMNVLDSGSYSSRNTSKSIRLKGIKVDNVNAISNFSASNQLRKGRCVDFHGTDGVIVEECVFTNAATDNLKLRCCTNYLIRNNEFSWACSGRSFDGSANGLAIVDFGYPNSLDPAGFDIRQLPGSLVTANFAAFNGDVGLDSWGGVNIIFSGNTTKSNSQVQSHGAGIALEGGSYGCKIVDNVAVDELQYGYGITRSYNTVFTGNSAFNCGAQALVGAITSSNTITSSTLISNNIFEYCAAGIYLYDADSGQLNGNVSIINNEINYSGYIINDGVVSPSLLSIKDAIYIQNGYNTIISSNRILRSGGNGILINQSTTTAITVNTLISLNTILISQNYGIRVNNLASVYIRGNIVKNNNQSVTGCSAIYFYYCSNSLIHDNDLSDDQVSHTQAYGYLLAGSVNISINNNIVIGNSHSSVPGNDVLPVEDGGTGLAVTGTNGQLLRSNGSVLEYFTPTYRWLYSEYFLSAPLTISPGIQNRVIEVHATSVNYVIALGPDSTTIAGTNDVFKNGGNYPLTIITGTGVTIEGTGNTYTLQPGSMFWIISTATNVWQIVYYSEQLGNAGVTHLIGKSAAVTYASGTGLGTGGIFSVVGTDLSGTLSFTTGTSPAPSAQVARITFAVAFSSPPHVVIGASGVNTANFYVNNKTSTFFDLYVGDVPLAASTAYAIDYIVVQ